MVASRDGALSSGLFCWSCLPIFPQMRASAADHDVGALVGTWRLVQYVDTPEGGYAGSAIRKLTGRPVSIHRGRKCLYQHHGIMRNPPEITAATTDPDPDACIPGTAVLLVLRDVHGGL